MGLIDQKAETDFNIKSILLMEQAGLFSFLELEKLFKCLDRKRVVIFAGPGKNGGDGLVLARYLFNNNIYTKVILLSDDKDIKAEDTLTNLKIVRSLGIEMVNITDTSSFDAIKKDILHNFDIVIDAILGIGIKKEIKGFYKEVVEFINSSQLDVISLDIPTGVNPDDGSILGTAIKASHTFCFGLPKVGVFVYPAAEYAGEIHTLPLTFPDSLIKNLNIKYNLITREKVKNLLPKKKEDIHKYQRGVVLFLGGARGMSGASYLCAKAAYKVGAGMVILAIPQSINDILQIKLPEAITKPLKENKSFSISQDAYPQILELSERADALIIGCGLSKDEDSLELVRRLIKSIKNKPIVLDGDGISAFVDCYDILKDKDLIITPHIGEFSRLLNITSQELNKNKLGYAIDFAEKLGITLVLKGKNTIIVCGREKQVYINTVGGKELAKAGTGDVLAGIIGGFLAQGLNLSSAAEVGVYLHGLAAEILKTSKTDFCLLASELINYIPSAFDKILSEL